jgi:GNAT superfamily N-acetyltransferase
MADLRIRRARPADLDVLPGELGERRFFTDRLERQGAGLGLLLTAWRLPVPIGVVYLWLEAAEEAELREHLPGTPILNHLRIHRAHRGMGAGTSLVTGAQRRLRLLGFDRVALAVEENNEAATRFYARLGFAEWPHGEVRCYTPVDGYGVRHAEICRIMVKELGGEVEPHAPVGEVQ